MQFKSSLTRISKRTFFLVASAMLSLSIFGFISVPAYSQEQGSQKQEGAQNADAPKDSAEGLNWQRDFDSAIAEAREQHKFVMVDVYTDWCVYCKKLDREVYTDPDIEKYLAEKFIVVKANAEDKGPGEAFCSRFDTFGAYPTIVFFDGKSVKEKPVAKIAGYLSPVEFNTALHSIVESKKYKRKHHKISAPH